MCGSLLSQLELREYFIMDSRCPSEAKGALVSCHPHSWSSVVPHLHLLAGDQPHKQLQAVTNAKITLQLSLS